MSQDSGNRSPEGEEFARQARLQRASFLSDLIYFLKSNRKWWLLPIIVVLLGFSLLMILATTGVAPFIYTLF